MAAPIPVPVVVPGALPPGLLDPPAPDISTSTSGAVAPPVSSSTAVSSGSINTPTTVPILPTSSLIPQTLSSPSSFTLTSDPSTSSTSSTPELRPSSSNAKQPLIIVFSIFGGILFLSILVCLFVTWIHRKNRKKRGLDIRPGKQSPSNHEEEYVHHWPSTRPLGIGSDSASEGYMSLSLSDAQSSLARDQESSHRPHHQLASGHTTGRSRDIHKHDPEDREGHRDLSPLDDDLQLTTYPVPPPRDVAFYSSVPNEQRTDPFGDEMGVVGMSPFGTEENEHASGRRGTTGETSTTNTASMMGRSAYSQVSDVIVTSSSGMREVSYLPASVRREGR